MRAVLVSSLFAIGLGAACSKPQPTEAPAAPEASGAAAAPASAAAGSGAAAAPAPAPAANGSGAAAANGSGAAAEGVVYAFAPANSKIEFVGAKISASHNGRFSDFAGTITVPGGDATKGSVVVIIQTASLSADSAMMQEKLNGHLKSPDFFDVAKFPTATFKSTSITAGAAAPATHTVTGDLEMHGVTKSVTFPATITLAAGSVTATAELTINRKDWNLVYPGMPDDLIKDDVVIKLNVAAAPK